MVSITSLKVEGLNGRLNYDLQFNERLNILTGRNGSGKTSILKMLWYIKSLNFDLLKSEINYDKVPILGLSNGKSEDIDLFGYHPVPEFQNEVLRALIYRLRNSFGRIGSYFFPTFRLIEGGFGINAHLNQDSTIKSLFNNTNLEVARAKFRHFIVPYDRAMNLIIFSISGIQTLQFITNEYANIQSQIDEHHKQLEKIIEVKLLDANGNETEELKIMKDEKKEKKAYEEEVMFPFTLLNELIYEFFADKGIKINEHLILGDNDFSDHVLHLSSGEKQMLTFLAYCLFTKDSIIFIDEPEISLHPDWQRKIIPTLLKHNNGNQYFIATHSPFIYSGYLDYNIDLVSEEGDHNEEN